MGKIDEVYPPQLLCKKLSNRGSFLITVGKYDEGIKLLTKCLKLTERKLYAATMEPPLTCKICSLESCIGMEEDSYSSILNSEKGERSNNQDENDHYNHANIGNEDGFVYRRPLLVPRIYIEEDRNMGIVLSLIILYNLALAHHLKAISMSDASSNRRTLSGESLRVLNQAMKLYELAYQLHLEYEQNHRPQMHLDKEQSVGSIRFTMIISNNLGQIHRVAGNVEKHQMCLHHLLSTIMYMVDSHLIVLNSSEMDGFYHNVSSIMIPDNCAEAA